MNSENYDAYEPLIEQGGDGIDIIDCIANNVRDQQELIAVLLRDAFQQGYVPSLSALRYCVRHASLERVSLLCSVNIDELTRILVNRSENE